MSKQLQSGTTFHIAVSVAGSLRQTDSELAGLVTLDDGTEATGHQARQWLRIQQMKGRKLLPVGEPCEGWSYETGCPGHRTSMEAP